jgi:uncharacterized membrane protein YfcA
MSVRKLGELVLIGIASFGMSYLGAAVGLVLGHFRLVLFTYVLGNPAAGAATSLAISTMSTVAGAVGHARGGRVHGKTMLLVGLPSAFGAYVAAHFAARIDPRTLKLAIAATLVYAAVDVARATRARGATPPSPVPRARWSRVPFYSLEVLVGLGLGALSGLVGLLLGSIRLPAMVRLGVQPGTAIGTNMAIGAITGFSGGASALLGGRIDLAALAVVAPMAILGSHLGSKRTAQLSPTALRRWIGGALGVTALILLGDAWLTRGS